MLVFIAISSLTLSLATRFCVQTTSQTHTTKSVERRAIESERQHLDRDAAQWVAPSPNFGIIEPITVESRSVSTAPALPRFVFLDGRYNRPPPSVVSL